MLAGDCERGDPPVDPTSEAQPAAWDADRIRMTISLTGAASSGATQAVQHGRHGDRGLLQSAAKALGMSVDDVRSQLQGGKSLADLAQDKGVSREDLLSALKQDAPQRMKDSGNLDQMLTTAIDRKGPPLGPRGAGGPDHDGDHTGGVLSGGSLSAAKQSTLDTLSSLLAVSSSELTASLQSGARLGDLLQAKGVDLSTLAASLEKGVIVDVQA